MGRLTEKRNGQNVIPLRHDGILEWSLWSADCTEREQFLYGAHADKLAEYEDLGLTPDQLKEVDKLYTEKCKQISDMSRYIVEKLDDVKPPYNRILDSLEENKMQVGQISGLNKAIKIVRECMENMDQIEFPDVCEPEYLSDSAAIGCRYGRCRCGTTVTSFHKYCHACGVKLEWGGVHG